VKLVSTLGPATDSAMQVQALAEAGTTAFRINFSHGIPEQHRAMVAAVRRVEEERGADLAILIDLPGPKIRLGQVRPDPLPLESGQRFVLRPDGEPGGVTGAGTSHHALAADVRPGDRIMLADGAVELEVRQVQGRDVVTECVLAGAVRSGAGVNVPAERLSLPGVTDRDRKGLLRALDLGATAIAQSFVRRRDDVAELRSLMGARVVPIVAKIETRLAVEAFPSILEAADAVMVARGDLGVELAMAEIPVLQKELLRSALEAGVPAIVATQMLESMTQAPHPTRAEASDVANAVLDGADAILLSAETAIGRFPIEAARAAVEISEAAEARGGEFGVGTLLGRRTDEAGLVAHAAAQMAGRELPVRAIACFSRSGHTVELLGAERSPVRILAFLPDAELRRQQAFRWGVTPLPAPEPEDTDEMLRVMDEGLKARGLVERGDLVVMVASSPAGRMHTNLIKLHEIGSEIS
jgi:pyruvate kinase